jgi:sugar O-acyltransferase, sialic acid O-acetyltransferase NeuD family
MILGIYGSGGLGREVLELSKIINTKDKWDNIVFIDDINKGQCNGVERYSFVKFIDRFKPADTEVVIALGEPAIREVLYKKVTESNYHLATLVHPNVVIPEDTKIGKGVVINLGDFVSCNVEIEDNAFLQQYVVIGHDSTIKRHTVVSAFVSIAGHCCIGEGTYIGMHVPVKETITIGDNVIIGMGSCVVRDIPNDVVAIGNPARAMRRNEERRVFKS